MTAPAPSRPATRPASWLWWDALLERAGEIRGAELRDQMARAEKTYSTDVILAADDLGALAELLLVRLPDFVLRQGGQAHKDGALDREKMARLIDSAGGMDVTLHRAFDMTRDPFEALDTAIELGCRTSITHRY